MSIKYFDLNHDNFIKLLNEKKTSRLKIAQHLHVSLKTVQRWVNRSNQRIRLEQLDLLAEFFKVERSYLELGVECIKVSVHNKALDEIIKPSYVDRVRASETWAVYYKILLGFDSKILPSEQELKYYKYLGIATIHEGMLQKARSCFERALAIALRVDSQPERNEICLWLAFYHELVGELPHAQELLSSVESHILTGESHFCRAFLKFRQGKVFLHKGKYIEATKLLRESILICYQQSLLNNPLIPLIYGHLGILYLRQSDFPLAKIAFKRQLESSRKCGWVRGKSVAHLALGILQILEAGEEDSVAYAHLGRARAFDELVARSSVHPIFDQFEFLRNVLLGNYADAARVNEQRRHVAKASPLYTAYLTLDDMILFKLDKSLSRPSEKTCIDAKRIFKDNDMTQYLKVLTDVSQMTSLATGSFLEFYPF